MDENFLERIVHTVRDMLGDRTFADVLNPEPNPDNEYTSVMIAVPVPDEIAQALAVEGGVPPEEMHITLAYLGDTAVLSDKQLAGIYLAFVALCRDARPLTGKLGGTIRFNASSGSNGRDVIAAQVDVPDLERLRTELMGRLDWLQLPQASEHGWTPHVTIAYIEPGSNAPDITIPDIPLRIDSLFISINGNTAALPMMGYMEPMYYSDGAAADIVHLCSSPTPNPGAGSDPAPHGGEGDNGRFRYFNEFTFAEPPDVIPYLPIPGTYKHPVYGDIVITEERLQRFVNNFNSGVYQEKLPIDAEHETKLSGAVGWITRMYIDEFGGVSAYVDWTERGEALIRDDRFKYFSPEWYEEWCDPATEKCYPDVAIGGALTTRPFFKDKYLRPLVSTELVYSAPGEQTPPAAQPNEEIIDMSDQPNETPLELTELQAQMAEMASTVETLRTELVATTEARTAAEQRAAALEETNTQLSEQANALSERIAAMEAEARRQRFTAMAEGGRDGNPWFGEASQHVAMMEKMAEAFGEDSDEFKNYVTQQEKIAEAMAMSELFQETGSNRGGDENAPEARVEAMVKTLREKNPELTYERAYTEVLEAHPDLYAELI